MQTEATIVPGAMAPIIRLGQNGSRAGRRECVPAMFGIVPEWASVKLAPSTCVAPASAVDTLPAYRRAWKRLQFCIVPMQAFFETGRQKERAVRWRIGHADAAPLAAAGIWEWRESGPDKVPLISFALLSVHAEDHPVMWGLRRTTDPRRMPVLLEPSQYDAWLHATTVNAAGMSPFFPK